ncbi:MAG: cell division protein FtsZ [Alphaproteobacteria bacterium]|nr:MAG: cell division protein FtsZ [Alphaproteobacteria bacterium]
MTLKLSVPKTETNLAPRITVIGVGGAGGNAVNNMIQSGLEGVDFVIANTDAQAMGQSLCQRAIQIGRNITQGLGAGARPDIGRAAAEESLDEILAELDGTNMVFITAGMGGGTGTGAAPVIARAAREAGILTVGVVTKPFHFEGVHRMRMAETGITEMTQYVDTLIVIPNQNLFRVANEKTTFADAFRMADDVLRSGVRGVTDLMVMPGLINLDFADIRSVMTEMGKAMMGTGEAEGDNRALAAAEAAISNPLLDEVSMKGARGVLINITGGMDLTLFEVDEAANRIRDEVDPDANIIFGSTFDQSLEGRMRVSVVATGIDANAAEAPRPAPLSVVAGIGRGMRATGTMAEPRPTASEAMAQPTVRGNVVVQARDDEITMAEPAAIETLQAHVEAAAADIETETEARTEARTGAETETAAAGTGDLFETPTPAANRLFAYSRAAARRESGAEARTSETMGDSRTQSDDAFIAPPPVAPDVDPSATAPAAPQGEPDPFAAAALANGSRAPHHTAGPRQSRDQARDQTRSQSGFDRKKAQRLFARVSEVLGGGGPGVVAREVRAEPRIDHQGAKSQPVSQPAAAPSGQPRLSGLDPAERAHPAPQPSEDEFLDIPAFLRRQAN